MSIQTTYYIERETAIAEIVKRISEMHNDKLGGILDKVINDRFANFDVVSVSEFNANKWQDYPMPYRESFEQPCTSTT